MDMQSTVANIDSHTLTAQIDPRIHRRCLDQIMMFLVKEKEEAADHLHVPPMRIKVLPNAIDPHTTSTMCTSNMLRSIHEHSIQCNFTALHSPNIPLLVASLPQHEDILDLANKIEKLSSHGKDCLKSV